MTHCCDTMTQTIIILSVLYLSCGLTAGIQNCSDCVYIHLCPEAKALQNSRNAEIIGEFIKAFCGVGYFKGQRKPKFCCSMLSSVEDGNNEETNDNIEKHPNSGLLPTDCGKQLKDRIFGGEIADIYEYPWMALLAYTSRGYNGTTNVRFSCGGTIINSKYILTAAHCVKNMNLRFVRVGEYDISKKIDCQGLYESYVCESHIQNINVENTIIHKYYNASRGNITNDIALLRVEGEIDFKHRNVAPICLPIAKDHWNLSHRKPKATVAGWGFTEKDVTADILRKVEVPILNDTTCFEYMYNKSKSDSSHPLKTICAGGELGKDSCKGDSGGPLMIYDTYNGAIRVLQIGVVSYGPMLCGSTVPAVYTDVTKYVDWILDNIET